MIQRHKMKEYVYQRYNTLYNNAFPGLTHFPSLALTVSGKKNSETNQKSRP